MTASSSAGSIACNGGTTTVTVSANGGTTPYAGAGSYTVSAGAYSYTVTDANGCSSVASGTVTQPTAMTASSAAGSIACNGGTTTVTVSATGGTTPYAGTGSYTVSAGAYSYTVTDANGCSSVASGTVTQPATMTASSSAGSIACNGGTTTVVVSATGGTSPYTGTGSYTVSAGAYTYSVTDANGCLSVTSGAISQPSAIIVSATLTNPIACFGEVGEVTITATGGVVPYVGTGTEIVGPGTWSYSVTDANGCTVSSSPVTVVEPAKVQAITTVVDDPCGLGQGSISLVTTGGVAPYSYIWSNGQNTSTATGLAVGSYNVTITDTNGCTGVAGGTVVQSINPVAAAGPISGTSGACRLSSATYSISPVANATGYTWTLPSGATGTSTTTSITVNFGATYGGGFICVTPFNTCGTGSQSCINVPVLTVKPNQPGLISLSALPCGPVVVTATVAAVPNATSYTWSVFSTTVAILSGQGTRTVQLSIPAGFTNAQLSVTASNCKGTSSARIQSITGLAVVNTGLTGNLYPCPNTTESYSVGAAVGATSYAWSISGDATISSSLNNSCVVSFGSAWSGGAITVSPSNACGANPRSYNLFNRPNQPGGISGPAFNLCPAAGATSASYSIAAVTGATSYNWTVPTGMAITANTGTAITVQIDPAFTGGSVCVAAVGTCGTSTARCLTVSTKTAAPGSITGANSVCASQTGVTYSVSAVANATGYSWSISGGAMIMGTGTSAVVDYPTATSTTAIITMNAMNACGASSPSKLTVNVNLLCREAQAGASDIALTAFPNPSQGMLTINFNAPEDARYAVRLLDMVGQSAMIFDVNAVAGPNMQEIDLRGMAKGVYLLNVQSEKGELQTLRLVIE